MSQGSQEQRDAPQIGKRAARRNQVQAEQKPTPEVTGIAHDIKTALRSDSWDALNALNQEFGELLYDAKEKTCRAAFSELKVAIGRDDKLHVLGEHLVRWVDEIADAIRTYLPYYASLADTGRVPRHKKWHWVEDAIREKLRSCCVELGAPAFWGFLWNVGPIETWTPLEWWLFNACSTANTFLLLRRESASIPEWLRPTTNPTSDPAGYYDMKLKTRLATALRKALNLAKIEAATGRQLPSQAIPVQDVLTTATALAGQANPINPSEPNANPTATSGKLSPEEVTKYIEKNRVRFCNEWAGWDKLTAPQLEAASLMWECKCSHNATAKLLGITRKTLDDRLHWAVQKFDAAGSTRHKQKKQARRGPQY